MADVVFATCNVAEIFAVTEFAEQLAGIDPPDPEMETRPLVAALAAHGVEATSAIWDDPAVDWGACRLCVLRSVWTYWLRPEAFLLWARQVAESCELWNPVSVIEWNIHKRYLLDLARKGVPTIPTDLVTRDAPRTVREVAEQHGWTDTVVKPALLAGSFGVGRFPALDGAAQDHLGRLLNRGDALVQRFMPSIQQRGEVSLVFFGGELAYAVHKQPRAREYDAQSLRGAEIVQRDPTDAELQVATRALDAMPVMPPYARVDLIEYDGSPVVSECELIEPLLYLWRVPAGVEHLTQAIMERLRSPAAGVSVA